MSHRVTVNNRGNITASAMTIRESFAMAALQGICAKRGVIDCGEWNAKMAVNLADKTLEELSKA